MGSGAEADEMTKVSVCHIISGDLWAGAEVMVFHLLKGLLNHKNINITAIVLNEGKLAEELRKIEIPIFLVNESKKNFFQTIIDVRKIVNLYTPDIIHSHRYKENILAYLVSKKRNKPRLLATQHGMTESYGQKPNFRHRMITRINFLLLSSCFDRTVAVSEDIRTTFMNYHGFREEKVTVVHNGIEMPFHAPATSRRGQFVVGSSGRFFAVKDYPLMVEIARKLLEIRANFRFELAGDGPERKTIQELIRKYGMGKNFILQGFIEDTADFYRGLDLYLNTSHHEGIPMSVLEAMSHGLPVVASDVGGLKEIVADGREGYLVKNRHPEEFADKCLKIYENDSLRQTMSAAAREKVKSVFSTEHMVQNYYDLYLTEIKRPESQYHRVSTKI